MSDDEDTPQPIEQVLGGIELMPFEDGGIVESVYVLAKLLNKDGQSYWDHRVAGNVNREEFLGVLTLQTELLRQSLVAEWDPE